jgi:hypothetical protein
VNSTFLSRGPQGPPGSNAFRFEIPTAVVPTDGETLLFAGSKRLTSNASVELVGTPLAATGETVSITLFVTEFTEGTHAAAAQFQIAGLWQRTSAGVSSKVSTSAGDQTSAGNSFSSPQKPTVSVSDPTSGVAPNVLHRAAILGTGKTGVNILLVYFAIMQRGAIQ